MSNWIELRLKLGSMLMITKNSMLQCTARECLSLKGCEMDGFASTWIGRDSYPEAEVNKDLGNSFSPSEVA